MFCNVDWDRETRSGSFLTLQDIVVYRSSYDWEAIKDKH